jgi:capsular polysaccharide biosynthesis protein
MRALGRHEPRSSPERDVLLDELFAEAGFEVVAPEQLSIDDQVRLISGARVLAGQAGSALHLAGFAPPGAHILELGDTRMPNRGVGTQRVINTLCGHSSAFIPPRWDHDQLVAKLCELGVWMSEPSPGDAVD